MFPISAIAIIYLALFVVATAVHLYASLKNDQYFRAVTKGSLLLLLLGFYLACAPDPELLLVLALLASWLGDLFLLGKGAKWFTAGGIAFMVSHLLFVATYCTLINWATVPWWAIVGLAALFVVAVCVVLRFLKPHLSAKLVPSMFGYLLINGAMNCFALYRLVSLGTTGALITAIGAVLFFASDTSLFFVRFNKNSRMKSHFLAMLTYSIGELLIVIGLLVG